MGTTPTRGLPYPEMTDRVADGWAAIRDLALAVEHSIDDGASGAITRGIVDAKGDLIVGTGADTVGRLAAGAPGYRLAVAADGTLAWVAPTDLTPYADKTAPTQQLFASSVRANGGLYDGANRVYSASNPPPGAGASIAQTIRGTITLGSSAATATATIAAVNAAKTQLRFLGAESNGTTTAAASTRVELTNATTVTATRSQTGGINTVGYELTEWV